MESGESPVYAQSSSTSFGRVHGEGQKQLTKEMAQKKSNEEIRREVQREDNTKDVNLYAAVTIAAVSGISSGAGVVAVLSLGMLEYFRKDVAALWLSCVPFCFPIITGLATAYRKQLGNVGIHIALLVATLLTGGAGYGYSIEPVFINRDNCTIVTEARGSCEKDSLVYIYIIMGGIAAGFGLLGLLISACACSNASKRRVKRQYEEELKLRREMDMKNQEVKHIKANPAPVPTFTTTNEIKEKPMAQNNVPASNGVPSDVTTHL